MSYVNCPVCLQSVEMVGVKRGEFYEGVFAGHHAGGRVCLASGNTIEGAREIVERSQPHPTKAVRTIRNTVSGVVIAFGIGLGLSTTGIIALLGWAVAILGFLTLRRSSLASGNTIEGAREILEVKDENWQPSSESEEHRAKEIKQHAIDLDMAKKHEVFMEWFKVASVASGVLMFLWIGYLIFRFLLGE